MGHRGTQSWSVVSFCQHMTHIHECELTITRDQAGCITAGLRVELPTRRADLADAVPITLSEQALRALAPMPTVYGAALTEMVFTPPLREAWQRARGFVEGQGSSMRLRIVLRGDDALHALRWELLCDPLDRTPLAYSERLRLSRFLSSPSLAGVEPVGRPRLHAVVAVANPSEAITVGLAPVMVAEEVGRARQALGEIPVTVLDGRDGRPRATLPALAGALRDGTTILYLVCHGRLADGQPYLYLEREDEAHSIPVAGSDLVQLISVLEHRPLLVVLASCQSAGDTYEILAAVGPALARAGVGAVIAMQGNVPQTLVEQLTPQLFRELQRDGQIDRALAAARAALPAEAPWWMPTLWMAVKDGSLWRRPAAPEEGRRSSVFQVPYLQNPLFRGRDGDIEGLARLLLGEEGNVTPRVVAVAGMGGIGKTQLASEFAYRYRELFPGGVFWLDMGQPEGVRWQVADVGGPGGLDLPAWHSMSFEGKVAAVRRAWEGPEQRLLVFDNLEEPRLLQDWRPRAGGARVLITTRRGAWAATSDVRLLHLQTPTRAESVRLLLGPRYGSRAEEILAQEAEAQEAEAICEELGDLPLALALAGAYLEQAPNLSLPAYRERLGNMVIAHPSLDADLDEDLPTQHAESVPATIALSYSRLDGAQAEDKQALALLQRIAYLAPAPVPARLLVRLAERNPDDEEQIACVDLLLRRLIVVGLIDRLPDGGAVMHRLIAAFARNQGDDRRAARAVTATQLIEEAYQVNTSGYPLRGTPYLAHLTHLVQRAEDLTPELTAQLSSNLGYLLQAQGKYTAALPYLERALAIREQALGPAHPDTIRSLNNLGSVLRARGEYAAARPYLERTLVLREQIYGPNHPATASSLNSLGALLKNIGEPGAAQASFERALAIYEQAFGDTHLSTVRSLNNLGTLLYAQGEYVAARPYLERALAIRKEALGPAHPDTASSLHNLAMLLYAQGEYATARLYLQRAVTIREEALGASHPTTALSLHNLAMLLYTQGEYVAARLHVERAAAIREQTLGAVHPDTATSLNNLSKVLEHLGDFAAARRSYERALHIFATCFGPNHPSTQTVLRNLNAIKALPEVQTVP